MEKRIKRIIQSYEASKQSFAFIVKKDGRLLYRLTVNPFYYLQNPNYVYSVCKEEGFDFSIFKEFHFETIDEVVSFLIKENANPNDYTALH